MQIKARRRCGGAAEIVTREQDVTDGRVTYAAITADGKKVLRSTAPVYRRGIERHFTRHLSTDEQQIVATALGRIVEAHRPVAEPRRGDRRGRGRGR